MENLRITGFLDFVHRPDLYITRQHKVSETGPVPETFEVFTAVTTKNAVFWDVMPCGSCKNRRFGGT
jgi:hypothetical protein